MADTIKEIFNGTVRYGELSNKLKTLFTTDANTKYVIRDVQVASSSYSTAPELQINGTKVATLSGNLSGSEIVDANSTISIKDAGGAPTFFNIGSMVGDTYGSGGLFTALSGGEQVAPNLNTSNIPNAGTVQAVTYLSQPATRWWFLNGDFYYYYYDSNSVATLYRRTGGPTGSQTQINNGESYRPVAFDGVSKFYWQNSYSTFNCYDTVTKNITTFNFPGVGSNGTTYGICVYCNGFLFFSHSYSNSPFFALHLETGVSTSIQNDGTTNNWSSNTYIVPFGNADKKTIRLVFTNGSTVANYYRDFSYNGSTLTSVAYGTLASPTVNVNCLSGFTYGDYGIFGGSAQNAKMLYVIDRDFKVVSSKLTNAVFLNGGTVSVVSSPTTTQLNESGPSISLRITGVKTS